MVEATPSHKRPKHLWKAWVSVLISYACSFDLAAQEAELPKSACEEARQKLCPNERDKMRVGACLSRFKNEIDDQCKQEIARIFEARKDAAAVGGGSLSSFGGPNAFGPPIPIASYEGRFYFGNDTRRLTENRLSISTPVHRGERNTFSVSLTGSRLLLEEKHTLSSGFSVPDKLDRVETGVQFTRRLENRRIFGVRASLGYAGDRPFKSFGDNSFGLITNYGFPGSEKEYWILMVLVSNNSPLANYLPLPGVAYLYRTPTFNGLFGFPVTSLQWTPASALTTSLSIFGPTVQSEIAYGSLDSIQTYLGYQLMQQSYIPSERAQDKFRLILQDQRLQVGTRVPIARRIQLETQLGRSFGRSIYLGNGFLNRDGGSTDLAATYYLNLAARILL